MSRIAAVLAWMMALGGLALAQPVSVIGPITPGDCPVFSSTTILKDSGSPCNGGTLYNNVTAPPFNGACNGVANDTTAVQAAFTAAITNRRPVYIPAGSVCTFANVTMTTGTSLRGDGPTSTAKMLASAAGQYMLVNANLGAYIDSVISIENLTIDGNNLGAGPVQTLTHGLIGFGWVTDLLLKNIKVYNYSYNCVELVGVVRARVINSEFTACGYMDHGVPNNGASLFISNAITDQSINVLVEGNYFHDALAMTFGAIDSVLNANVFQNMKEVGLNYPRGGGPLTQNNVISNNIFDGTVKLMVSGSCIEADAVLLTQFIGNTFRNCYQDGILLTNPQEILVEGNVISNVGLQPGYAAVSAGIKVHSSNASPSQPQNITIRGNRVYDDQGTPTTGAGVALRYTFGGTTPVINLSIADNDFSKTAFVSGSQIVEVDAGIIGAGSIVRNNLPVTVNRPCIVSEGCTGIASGTSGGVPYFSSTTTVASSALLAANQLVLGGGAGAAPASLGSLGTTTTVYHGNAAGAGTFGAVVSADLNITTTACTNQFVTAISSAAAGTCTTDTLASAQHANQGTTTTVLHGNAAGNPSWSAVALADLATQATNTVLGNATSGTAVPTALAVGTCSTAASALIWTTNTGFGCNTSITAATLSAVLGPALGGTGVANNAASTITVSGNFGLTFTIGAARNITVNGNPTLNDWFDQSVKTTASPTFANATISTALTVTAGPVIIGTNAAVTNAYVNGSSSGTGGGAFLSVQNAGVGVVALGNRSAILGGAYDGTGLIFSGVAIIVATNNTNAFEFFTDQTAGPATLAAATANTLCYSTTAHTGFNTLSTCSSLKALKDDVGPITNAKETVLALDPRIYWSKTSEAMEYGLYAEDVEKIAPMLATYYDGKLNGVDYMHLSAVLVAAFQELSREVGALRAAR